MQSIDFNISERASTTRAILRAGVAFAAVALFAGSAAHAEDTQVGDVKFKIEGTATIGTSIRTTDQNPVLIPSVNGNLVGVPGTAVGGRNQDDGNLNFNKGKPVSTVAKGVMSIDAGNGDVGVFVRGKAWYDFTLSGGNVPFGNFPNSYRADAPLSDAGFSNDEKFISASLLDAYLYGHTKVGDATLSGKLGNQVIGWGSPFAIPGGLFTSINAIDFNAYNRPGMLPEEVVVRMPAAYGKAELDKHWSIEGFYQFASTHNQANGCGTFYSGADYIAPGCNAVMINGANDRAAITGINYAMRGPTPDNHDPEFGLGTSYLLDQISTKFSAYYAHVDSRTVTPSVITSTRPLIAGPNGQPFIAGAAGVPQNVQYFTEYAPNIDVISGTFNTKLGGSTTVSGEATFKHNAPINLNAADLINGFATNGQPTLLRADATAAGRTGAIYHGYDTYNQGHYQLGGQHQLPGIFGATSLQVGEEAALKQVYDLPDVSVRRYGRPDVFGVGPVAGVCVAGAPAYQCTTAGYTTSNAWGYRVNASLKYQDAFLSGLTVTPSIGVAHDVYGWSADGVFSQGRVVLNLGVRTDYKAWFASAGWNPAIKVGTYDNLSDRQVVTVATGVKF